MVIRVNIVFYKEFARLLTKIAKVEREKLVLF